MLIQIVQLINILIIKNTNKSNLSIMGLCIHCKEKIVTIYCNKSNNYPDTIEIEEEQKIQKNTKEEKNKEILEQKKKPHSSKINTIYPDKDNNNSKSKPEVKNKESMNKLKKITFNEVYDCKKYFE